MPKVVLKLGDNVSTDDIYPGRFMATVLPSETPQYAFADHASFNGLLNQRAIPPGSVVVAGNNFGCGSSREQAASCLKGHDLTVVARSFSRIFMQNAINLGLRIVVASIDASEGDELEWLDGRLHNVTRNKTHSLHSLPKARQSIIDAGGLVAYTRQKLLEKLSKQKNRSVRSGVTEESRL